MNLLGSDVAGLDVGMGFGDGTRLRDDVTGLHNQVSWLGLLRISGPPVYRTPGSGRVAGGPGGPCETVTQVLPLFVDVGNVEYKLSY